MTQWQLNIVLGGVIPGTSGRSYSQTGVKESVPPWLNRFLRVSSQAGIS